jgi:hypothetical protein
MDYESADSRKKGCWDPRTNLAPFFAKWSVPNPDFVVDEAWRRMVASLGFSNAVSQETLSFWDQTLKEVYCGEKGRKKLRMALLNLLERDGLLLRLSDIKCPVHWLHVSVQPWEGRMSLMTEKRAVSLARATANLEIGTGRSRVRKSGAN